MAALLLLPYLKITEICDQHRSCKNRNISFIQSIHKQQKY